MSDNGYDVWLGNARGNRHSMLHVSYNSESKDFWSFSWHEIGYYDLPAMFDYMLRITYRASAYFIGHSQGATNLLVLLTTRPEYNQKIIQGHLMATPAYMYNVTRPLAALLNTDITWDIASVLGVYKSPSIIYVAETLAEIFCSQVMPIAPQLCQNILFMLLGRKTGTVDIDLNTLAIIPQHVSSYVSIMQIRHYVQCIKSGKFQRYNYKLKNQQYYNTVDPPSYQMRNIVAPIYLYQGADDILVSRWDADVLKTMIPSCKEYKVIDKWCHYDFIYSRHARTTVYNNILNTIDSNCPGWERVAVEKRAILWVAQVICDISNRG